MSVSYQISDQVDGEVGWTAVPGMLDLRDVFQLIIAGLDDEAFMEQKLISKQHKSGFHIFAK